MQKKEVFLPFVKKVPVRAFQIKSLSAHNETFILSPTENTEDGISTTPDQVNRTPKLGQYLVLDGTKLDSGQQYYSCIGQDFFEANYRQDTL